jgi:hypothetical protein
MGFKAIGETKKKAIPGGLFYKLDDLAPPFQMSKGIN